jgi:hypothetical protein
LSEPVLWFAGIQDVPGIAACPDNSKWVSILGRFGDEFEDNQEKINEEIPIQKEEDTGIGPAIVTAKPKK